METAFSTHYRFSLYLKYNISIQTFCQPAAAAAWLNLRNWFHSTFRANADMLTLMEFTPQGVKVLLSLSSGFHFPFCRFITFYFFRLAGCMNIFWIRLCRPLILNVPWSGDSSLYLWRDPLLIFRPFNKTVPLQTMSYHD